MAIDFPTGVPAGTEFTSAGVTWKWDGQKWVSQATGGGGGGGVTQITAGTNITIDPDTGVGNVTINATGGGGGSGMPTGGGAPPEDAFYENTMVIDEDYQIADGKNAGSFGPITVNSTVTVPDGQTWTVVGGEGGGGGTGGGSGADAWGKIAADGTLIEGYNCTTSLKSAGKYQVVYDTPLSSANYSVVQSTSETSKRASYAPGTTTTGLEIRVNEEGGALTNGESSFAVFASAGGGGGGGGTTINYNGADAWGTVGGDGSLQSGFNVASTTKSSTGVYAVTFVTPMANDKYAVITSGRSAFNAQATDITANGFNLRAYDTSNSPADLDINFTVQASNAIAPQAGVGADAWGEVSGGGVLQSGFNATVSKVDSGIYAITFTTPMPSSSYAAQATCIRPTNAIATINDMSKTGFQVRTRTDAGTLFDSAFSFTVHASSTITPTFTWTRDGTTLLPANAGDDVRVTNSVYAGTVQANGGANSNGINFRGISGNTETFRVDTDGTITVAGQITANVNNASGDDGAIKAVQTNLNGYALWVGSGPTATNRTAFILPDGSAGFAGGNGRDQNNSFGISSAGALSLRHDTGSDNVITVFSDDRDTVSAVIKAGGAAQFGNAFDPSSGSVRGFAISHDPNYTTGLFQCKSGVTTNNAIEVWQANAQRWAVDYSGTASFSNAILRLDPDNSANYVSTTNAEGETESVYNGPTLDVKALLLEFQSKIETLEAAKEALEARITTLEGGSN